MVKGPGQLTEFIRQSGIRCRGIKLSPFNAFACGDQIVEWQDHLTTDASQGKHRQQQDPQRASQREQGHRLNFMFGIVLKGEHKGINTANKIFDMGLIPREIAAGDVRIHLLPGQMQLLVALFDIVRHVPAVQLL